MFASWKEGHFTLAFLCCLQLFSRLGLFWKSFSRPRLEWWGWFVLLDVQKEDEICRFTVLRGRIGILSSSNRRRRGFTPRRARIMWFRNRASRAGVCCRKGMILEHGCEATSFCCAQICGQWLLCMGLFADWKQMRRAANHANSPQVVQIPLSC